MMNVALIFAGGSGTRMNTKSMPKQFLTLHGKEIIIYTIEHFERHPEIDKICVVCKEDWIDYLKKLLRKNQIEKVEWIVPGGATGQDSIYNGLEKIHQECPEDSIVLIHDGVRPLIDAKLISDNIKSVREHGSAITVTPVIETVMLADEDNKVYKSVNRDKSRVAKAPQSFVLKDIYAAHQKAIAENCHSKIDSATMMSDYGYSLYTVEGSSQNIKITTPTDYFIFKALIDAKENSQIFGLD
jgi:2-C-methyl-D-erythritol 4-phosphate cytidylyltransferase